MAEKVKSPAEVMKLLPQEDCGECGSDSCFEFALKLVERTTELERCPKLKKAATKKIKKMLAPPMAEITFGSGDKMLKTGGEEVMCREELAFFGKTILAYDVWDTMSEERLVERVQNITGMSFVRFKETFTVDAIAIRSVSGDPMKFKDVVKKVSDITDLPLILCSLDPKVLKAGAKVLKGKKPLLYAATKDNWEKVLDIAKEFETAVAIFSPDDLDMLGSIAATFQREGIGDLILDPGTFCEPESITQTLSNFSLLRRACVKANIPELSYPVMAVPAVASMSFKSKKAAAHYENYLANIFVTKGINLMILHFPEIWEFMPIVYLREGIFKHPKLESAIDPDLYAFNEPDADSPLMVTANYTLTYGIVSGDLDRYRVKCWLLVIDTNALSVDTAVGSGDFCAENIVEHMEEFDVESKVNHRVLIIPRVAAEILPELREELPDWKVVLGPKDSSEIATFLTDEWKNLVAE
ncbi:MAG: acetyl-CoA decarbonylase/synthase complex gamma subunit [Candidatus Syntrophoarchaeum caldarius]|uniref:Acetyl-CoA decarbonylase/synthase complex gamma subunit n=1 Tax=Candidatus Syntropharchaeum caldarium TaxID=1838285 RepID=A0A1F2PA53_9EURY|nr:MAG: acetyl-CoA decarbonylase/synthase complex gamma subunit [Candidatus Syntrophoarchaeum caldarius]